MQRSFIDYAMSVIVSRALPDVRDGLKPVHRRVLYGMYDSGFRPDRSTVKSSRVVGDVMGNYHPHGDSPIYDTVVRMAQPWSLRYPMIDGQGNFGSMGNDPPAAMRYTECRLTQLAMLMLDGIGENTVDMVPNYDNKTVEPTVLPARIPNLLVNGSSGIAVGMATNIPPHNLREVASAVVWALANPESSPEELLDAAMSRIKGPDFPTGSLIVGSDEIADAYRTGRGSIRMRAVVAIEEDTKGRTILVVTELPYQVNPDNLVEAIAQLHKDGKIAGIADIADESSDRVGMRLVITLKRDAVAKVVMANLFKHTALQTSFGANMLAIVDGVPRTLRLDQMISLYVAHQIEVIVRRTQYRLTKAEERAHVLRGLVKALDMLDEVIALIRRSPSAEESKAGLMELLDVDDIQATAILDMQLRRLAALERQRIIDELAELERVIADLRDILAKPERQRAIIRDELNEAVDKHGDDRRTRLVPYDGDVSIEDLIAVEDVVVTITRTGYAKRTKTDLYRAQRRGGKGGLVKKSELTAFDTNRSGGIVAINLRDDDELVGAVLCGSDGDLLLISAEGQSIRFHATDEALRPMGRATSGVLGMRFNAGDELLSMDVVQPGAQVLVATERGYAKRTDMGEYPIQGRGGKGVLTIQYDRRRGKLVGALIVEMDTEVYAITSSGGVIRTQAREVRKAKRQTMGVRLMNLSEGDSLVAIARNVDDEVAPAGPAGGSS